MSKKPAFSLLFISFVQCASGYSVLTHEAVVDALWNDSIRPVLLSKFPATTEEELVKAHAYAYGGCIIQDLGYYPFGNHLFSDLVHYVRSADFVEALLTEATDVNEYAFALGAVAHYGSDVEGHSIAVNRAVPILYPRLRQKFGDEVTYGDDPSSHLKTEFGFDVLQVARGHYASKAYHDFIGFEVSKDLLDRAFQDTYDLKLKDLFGTLDLALGTYRFSVSNLLPSMTRAAWQLKKDEIEKDQPSISRKQFLYNMRRSAYRQEWGNSYRGPGFLSRILVVITRILPRIGPLKGLAFKVPTPVTEKMFEDSFDAAVKRDKEAFLTAKEGTLRIANLDLDTGKRVAPGEYLFTDKTYDKLVLKLASKQFEGMTPALRDNILGFYGRMTSPDAHGIEPQLEQLRSSTPATAAR